MKKSLCVALFFLLALNLFAQEGKDYIEISLERTAFPDWGLPFPANQIPVSAQNHPGSLSQYAKKISYARQVLKKLWITISYSYFNGMAEDYYLVAGTVYQRKLQTISLSCSLPFYQSSNNKFNAFMNAGPSLRFRQEEKIDSLIAVVSYDNNTPIFYYSSPKNIDIGLNMSVSYKYNFYKGLYFGNRL